MTLSLTMFQAMVYIDKYNFDVKRLINEAITCVCIHPPGKLQINLDFYTEEIIGSINFKLSYNATKYSILLFQDKFKLSGGFSQQHESDILFSQDPDNVFNKHIEEINMLLENILKIHVYNYNVCLINGRYKTNVIRNYISFANTFVDRYKNEYIKSVLPYQRARGRIAALKLYTRENVKTSIHFDHSGSVQFFAYKKVVDMILDYMDFKDRLENCLE